MTASESTASATVGGAAAAPLVAGLTGRKLLFIVNVDWFFLSHRLPIALAAKAAGAEVIVAAAETGRRAAFETAGIHFIPLALSRQGRNPLREFRSVAAIARLLHYSKPEFVHLVALKPVLYGNLAAMMVARRVPRVNALSGLGFAFSADSRAQWLRHIVQVLFRIVLRSGRSVTILQNKEDLAAFIRSGLLPEKRAALIRGSGVDLERFRETPPPSNPVVMLAARMLWDKGVAEFVAAARLLRAKRPGLRFVLAGGPDTGNPKTIPVVQLMAWVDEGIVEWWGHRTDMPSVLAQATIVVLPTYYPEGLPKVLLEAAAVGRPIVATDVPGCREFVVHDVNGLLVPPRDVPALAGAILDLLRDPSRASRLAAAALRVVGEEFTEAIVVARTLEIYESLARQPPPEDH